MLIFIFAIAELIINFVNNPINQELIFELRVLAQVNNKR